jgi:hypothetical protein
MSAVVMARMASIRMISVNPFFTAGHLQQQFSDGDVSHREDQADA